MPDDARPFFFPRLDLSRGTIRSRSFFLQRQHQHTEQLTPNRTLNTTLTQHTNKQQQYHCMKLKQTPTISIATYATPIQK
jgi:hypothetical protein